MKLYSSSWIPSNYKQSPSPESHTPPPPHSELEHPAKFIYEKKKIIYKHERCHTLSEQLQEKPPGASGGSEKSKPCFAGLQTPPHCALP